MNQFCIKGPSDLAAGLGVVGSLEQVGGCVLRHASDSVEAAVTGAAGGSCLASNRHVRNGDALIHVSQPILPYHNSLAHSRVLRNPFSLSLRAPLVSENSPPSNKMAARIFLPAIALILACCVELAWAHPRLWRGVSDRRDTTICVTP